MDVIKEIYKGVTEGNRQVVAAKVKEAVEAKIPAVDILNQGLIAAMAEVGRLFEEGEYFVPEMLVAARAMQEGLGILRPYLVQAKVESAGKVVIGTVKGDLHDIGKNLVKMMLEGAGFEIVDLGTDVTPDKFVQAIKDHKPNVLGMSALLTTTMPSMVATLTALKAAGVRESVKVMIGGAPVTDTYAKEIGADGYAPDASRAVAAAKALVA
jgi:5-methyltetrahydrofolate--homocysteine methyltransferase